MKSLQKTLERLDKTLEAANMKLSSITSKVMTVTTRLILDALVGGQTDPATLALVIAGAAGNALEHLRALMEGGG